MSRPGIVVVGWRAHPRGRWVVLVGGLLLAAFAAVAWVQWRQYQLLSRSVRPADDGLAWSFVQLETDYLALRDDLGPDRPLSTPRQRDALRAHFQSLASRIRQIDPARLGTAVATPDPQRRTWQALDGFVQRAGPLIDGGAMSREQQATLHAALDGLHPPVHALSAMASALALEQTARRNDAIREQIHRGIGLTAFMSLLTLAFAAIVVHQWRASLRRGSELEDLADHLRRARESADSANLAKTAFLATMSHELRTPFNGLLGMLALLDDERLDQEQARSLRAARESAEHLLAILDDILDVSRLESGTVELQPAAVDLRRLIAEVQAVMAPPAAAKGLALSVSVADDLPPWVLADGRRVKQLLFNLLSNAVKFTEQGRIGLAVSRVDGPSQDLSFTVTDTGIGIDAATLGRLFQRFSQGDAGLSRRYGGTGLGLEISRNLARLMGGDITVTSQPGAGSRFVALLPLPAADAPPMPPAAPAREAALAPLDILVAEDHPVNRMYVGTLLHRMGHRVRFAENGDEVLAASAQQLPDLILMDVHMPGIDGLQAARALRARPGAPGRVKIVALTADAIQQTRKAALASGMDDFLAKPFRWDDMAQLLRRLHPDDRPDGAAPLLDLASIAELQAMLSPEGYRSMLEAFLDDLDGSFAALCGALADGDAQPLARRAHHVGGAARVLGLKGLAEQAAALERQAAALTPATPAQRSDAAARLQAIWRDTQALCRDRGLIGTPSDPQPVSTGTEAAPAHGRARLRP